MESFFGKTIRRRNRRLTSSSHRDAGRKGGPLTLERLDPRLMMAGDFYGSIGGTALDFGISGTPESAWAGSIEYSASSNTLSFIGGDYDDDATVEIQDSKLVATITSTAFGLSESHKMVFSPVSLVSSITFTGGDGNDSFENSTSISSEASGGYGDDILNGGSSKDILNGNQGADELNGGKGRDTLRGGDGNDILHGGGGRDKLYGGKDDDSLYGDAGNDSLFGYGGNDGLYGGVGEDNLTGGTGSDRFLYIGSDDDLTDVGSDDAQIEFENGGVNWTEGEIEAVDEALRTLHHSTGDKTLLERRSGKRLTFVREQSEVGPDVLGINRENGKIVLNDLAFTAVTPLSQTVYHEIGHNWDDEGSIWSEFRDESGWDRIGWFESQDDNQSVSGDGE